MPSGKKYQGTDAFGNPVGNVAHSSILKGNSEATGTINVYSERTVCPSCDNVAKAFSRDYPNLEIALIDSSGKVYILKNGEIIG